MVKMVKVKLFFSIEYVVFNSQLLTYHTCNVREIHSCEANSYINVKISPVDEITWNYGLLKKIVHLYPPCTVTNKFGN